MRIAEVVYGVPFANTAPGNIIQFFDETGKLHTALKVRGEQCDGVLFLKTHPLYSGAEIFWLRDNRPPWREDIMLEFPGAMLLKKEFSQLIDGHGPRSGDLTIHQDGTTRLLSNTYRSARYVDMNTGEVTLPNAVTMPSLVVSRWVIVVPTDNASTPLVQFPK